MAEYGYVMIQGGIYETLLLNTQSQSRFLSLKVSSTTTSWMILQSGMCKSEYVSLCTEVLLTAMLVKYEAYRWMGIPNGPLLNNNTGGVSLVQT